jgi:RND family efflux transporter MFP subunit
MSACGDQEGAPEEVRLVRTERIAANTAEIAAVYSGEVRARREADLGFMVSGRILRRHVEVGDRVEIGTRLFQIDATDASLNANASRSQVETARSQLRQAQDDYDRYVALGKSNYVSKADVEKMRLALETAQQTLRATQANYGVVANQTKYTTLRSTTSGIVTALEAEAGQVVQAGQVVVRVAQKGEREIAISVPESRVDELVGAKDLSVELWAEPGRRYRGRVREIAPATDEVTRTYSARVSVLDADERPRLGMTAKVLVPLRREQGLRRVPLTAIYDVDGTSKVWIVDAGTSRVAKRSVTIARAQKDGVLIGAGLRDGDIVVTAGVHLLHEGQKVRLSPDQAGRGAQQ